MVSRYTTLLVALASCVAAQMTTFATSTTPYEVSRPAGVPGGAATAVFGEPGSPNGNSAYYGGGQLWGTAGVAGGRLAGTAAGGPNGPNNAAGIATGKYDSASGFLAGSADPTKQIGCGGAGYGDFGQTICVSNPTPLP